MNVKKVSNTNPGQFTKKNKRYSIHQTIRVHIFLLSNRASEFDKIMILYKSHDFELLLIFLISIATLYPNPVVNFVFVYVFFFSFKKILWI